MSAKRNGKPHVLAWTLAILVAVPVLYLASEPPVWYLIESPTRPRPNWANEYAQPFVWVRDHTIIGKPLAAYEKWCGQMIPME